MILGADFGGNRSHDAGFQAIAKISMDGFKQL